MESRLTAVETKFDTILPSLARKEDILLLKTDIASFETRLAIFETRIIRWVAGIGLATVTSLLSMMGFFFSKVEMQPKSAAFQTAVQPTVQPIIITIPNYQTTPSS